jgi:two-component system, cell cycle sensor histidine kinase and response regulator CckA
MNKMPAHKNQRVLVIDDNRAIHDDFRKILSPTLNRAAALSATEAAVFGHATDEVQQTRFEVDSAYQGQEGVLMVKKALDTGLPYAMAFVDVRMPPGWDGVETTKRIWEIDSSVQIVICTAYSDYSWGEMFEKLGHRDGLLILKKPFDAVEAFQLAHALTEKWWLHLQFRRKMEELESRVGDRTRELQRTNEALQTEVAEHQRAEEELRKTVVQLKQTEVSLVESDTKFRQLADNVTDVFWMTSPDLQKTQYVSRAYEKIFGRSVESVYANPLQWAEAILPEDRERVHATFSRLAAGESSVHAEFPIARPDGTVRWIFSRGFQVRDAAGNLVRIAGIASDITERKHFEAKLVQSQKMETVGKLAGGIAHEFNSILTAIIGQSELLLVELPAGNPLSRNATEIRQAAGRAATLTRQLLAYGRKQILQPEILDLNQVLASMQGMIRHLIGSDVNMQIVGGLGLQAVLADAGQIEQVIMNMVINAREAMPNGGKLTLETANVSFDQESVGRYPELRPGDYVMLAITDTGAGMSGEVKARAFEPFYSTKDVGEGTGLGLSTCYGIVKQSGGHISVYSEQGRGATFKIYLPQVQQQTKGVIQPLDSKELPRGTETILLVEDDPALREMAGTLLRRLGYTVWSAANGVEALSLKQQRNVGHIDLLFTDVVMPHMSGKELADRVQSLYPHTRILFTSAYTESAIVHQGVLNKGVALLQKPFTPSALARKVREILDQPGAPKSDGAQQSFGFTQNSAETTTAGLR